MAPKPSFQPSRSVGYQSSCRSSIRNTPALSRTSRSSWKTPPLPTKRRRRTTKVAARTTSTKATAGTSAAAAGTSAAADRDWRQTSRPIKEGGTYPAKEHCSNCGLCDTYYIAHVKDACGFLGDGMSKVEKLEQAVHGRRRDSTTNDRDELHFGVYDEILYAKKKQPLPGAQWTGIVTSVAMEMLKSKKVDGVVCVASEPTDPMVPNPILAVTVEQIESSKGVKPCLSPNLRVLEQVEQLKLKKLLFIGVGCSVSALRAVEPHLRAGGLEELYVMGTFCVDNGPSRGLKKFLNAASDDPDTVTQYEFMQDYNVHLKHTDGSVEKTPYFSLPADDLKDVIAPSCYACFDYMNNLADLVVGYMGVPWQKTDMKHHQQTVVVRNSKGAEMLDLLRQDLDTSVPISQGDRKAFVLETVNTDDKATLNDGTGPPQTPAPKFVGKIIAWLLEKIGPRGLEFARYSLDYHWIRNYLYVQRNFKPEHAERHVPEFVKKVVAEYDKNGDVSSRSQLGRRDPKDLR
eukprot:CAMPEP_0197527104 /NCGR_PEP_ID=MMETSP1318-20131121/20323_1 /TAXON_ID=552666 /ORGANISM="Partenskyella glossopodia, Strain RCC365" /LENGTH=515 /DNA_ID=CAMNT_0043081573 /DNA_START=339 /DNA_END=1889 /DNA_ORIENTATION=-